MRRSPRASGALWRQRIPGERSVNAEPRADADADIGTPRALSLRETAPRAFRCSRAVPKGVAHDPRRDTWQAQAPCTGPS